VKDLFDRCQVKALKREFGVYCQRWSLLLLSMTGFGPNARLGRYCGL